MEGGGVGQAEMCLQGGERVFKRDLNAGRLDASANKTGAADGGNTCASPLLPRCLQTSELHLNA